MTQRLNYAQQSPELFKKFMEFSMALKNSVIEDRVHDLVQIRASQINGCAFCLHMHTRDARAGGETEERIYLLDAWRESPLYTARERAALAWTEAVTLVSQTHVPDEAYAEVREQFDEKDLVKLTMLLVAINGWNRIAISFRSLHPVKAARAS